MYVRRFLSVAYTANKQVWTNQYKNAITLPQTLKLYFMFPLHANGFFSVDVCMFYWLLYINPNDVAFLAVFYSLLSKCKTS